MRFARQSSENIEEVFHRLVIEGRGGISFEGGRPDFIHGQRHLFLDDLEVKADSMLSVTEWEWGRDHLLVRRDSKHLQESLKRMQFAGYDSNAIHLVDYNKDYWEISALPEPAAYGAGLMLGVIGFARYRRRRKCRRTCPGE
ncbi:hypothetical protein AXK11_08680 [Cephaloticoccus primus]|uniref:PEP-CTERM protein-sorting domain-containing protein n=1 Tax=Cephaloticoccus primus TaxID=1548207 RepID=A0A139SIQ8_9BACT|nr:hypothetical protein AXK11_08680 [Cephaloticoccus primus]